MNSLLMLNTPNKKRQSLMIAKLILRNHSDRENENTNHRLPKSVS